MANASVGFNGGLTRTIIKGVFYKGEPVYRQWSDDRTEVNFFSRETKQLPNGGWKFVRWIPLKQLKLPRKLDNVERMRQVYEAQAKLMEMEGIAESTAA